MFEKVGALKKREKNQTANQKTKKAALQQKSDSLFNIKHNDQNFLIKVPKDKFLSLEPEIQRKGYMGLGDKEHTRSERKRIDRTESDQG